VKFHRFIYETILRLNAEQIAILLKMTQSYNFLNMTAYRFFSIKNFRLQQQFNSIVETAQLTNDQMPKFHCYCECSKCPSTAPRSNTSFQSVNLKSLSQPCRSVLVAVVPDNLKRFLEFGECFRLCFKLGLSLQHCTPHVIVHWVYRVSQKMAPFLYTL